MSFSNAGAVYRYSNGTTISFAKNSSSQLYPLRLTRPDGFSLTFIHEFGSYTTTSRQCATVPTLISCEPAGNGFVLSEIETERLSGIETNSGYALSIAYSGTDPRSAFAYHDPSIVTLSNTQVANSARSVSYQRTNDLPPSSGPG